jgi:hypothetical protein
MRFSGRTYERALLIVCHRRACGRVREVSRLSQQKRQKFCSRTCANLATANIRGRYHEGVKRSAQNRKRRLLARVAGLTPLEAFKVGYRVGLEGKLTQIRKHYVLTKKLA